MMIVSDVTFIEGYYSSIQAAFLLAYYFHVACFVVYLLLFFIFLAVNVIFIGITEVNSFEENSRKYYSFVLIEKQIIYFTVMYDYSPTRKNVRFQMRLTE